MEETFVSFNVRGKREAILAKRRVSSLVVMGPLRRIVRAPLTTWQFVPAVEEVQVSDEERYV